MNKRIHQLKIKNAKLIEKFIFNGSNCLNFAIGHKEYNEIFISSIISYLNELIRCRGYLYLNQIYEQFGINWSVSKDNLCFTGNVSFYIKSMKSSDESIAFELWCGERTE